MKRFELMPHVRRLFVWVMVALWLPATLHCAIDRAGMFESQPACCDEHANQIPDAEDCAERCDLLNGGTPNLANDVVKVSAPVLLTCLSCLVERAREPVFVPLLSPVSAESPPEWVRTWQFVERAAWPARAPSFAS